MKRAVREQTVEIAVAFAADHAGRGVAYAAISDSRETHRVPFFVKRLAGQDGREIRFAALAAVAKALPDRHRRNARFVVGEAAVAADLRGELPVPQALAMPYVALRCAINGFGQATFTSQPKLVGDLEYRARAEVALHVAA